MGYTVGRWSTAQAVTYLQAIRDACDGLSNGTQPSRRADDLRPGYRKCAVGSHLLFYRVLDDGMIDIVRILHQRMMPRPDCATIDHRACVYALRKW